MRVENGKHIIRTSDRIDFKKCRRKWDLGSIIREGWVPDRTAKPLEFGTDIHTAMDVYYEPSTWELVRNRKTRETIEKAAIAQFTLKQKERLDALREPGTNYIEPEIVEDYEERVELGVAMLENYFIWAPANDDFTPIYTEVDFEVQILTPNGEPFFCDCHGLPVVYQGRLDGIIKDKLGWYWILEHKTAATLGDVGHLQYDEQTTSYAWALQHMLGIRVQGVIYNELAKKAPHPPKRNKNRRLGAIYTVAKDQDTTYELYLKTLQENGEPLEPYADILEHLREQGNKFVRRTPVNRNLHELANMGEQIYWEARDMINPDLPIYPNPSRFTCSFCNFKIPCLAMNDGSDYQFLLEEDYRQRTDKEIEARRARV